MLLVRKLHVVGAVARMARTLCGVVIGQGWVERDIDIVEHQPVKKGFVGRCNMLVGV